MSHWLVSVPNEKNRSSETTFLEVKAETASSRHNYASNMQFYLIAFAHFSLADVFWISMLPDGTTLRLTRWNLGLIDGTCAIA